MSNYLVVKDKVQRFAKEVFNQVLIDDDGDLVIPYESTRVFISVTQKDVDPEVAEFWNEHQLSHNFVEIWAPVLVDVKPSAELFEWVARDGQEYNYGGIRVIDHDGGKNVQLIFRVALPGDSLDPGELKDALFAVALTADELDDELKKRFGGKRIDDL